MNFKVNSRVFTSLLKLEIRWLWPIIIVAALILFGSIGGRLIAVQSQFAHIDDIGVATTILEARRDINSVESLRAVINNKTLRQYESPKLKILRHLDRAGLLAPTFNVLSVLRDVLAVPLRWTYAPAQYLLTPLLLPNDASYRITIFLGRLPSLLFSILAILSMPLIAWRLTASDRLDRKINVSATALAVMALSLEQMVFAAHMSNYAAGIFGGCLLLLFVMRPPDPSTRYIRAGVLMALVFWALVHVSYQILFLLPAAFLALGISAAVSGNILVGGQPAAERLQRLLRMPCVWALVIAAIVFAIAIIPSCLLLMTSARTATWNVGRLNEFLFTRPQGSLVDFLIYAVRFTVSNFAETFAAMISPVPVQSLFHLPVATFFFLLYVLGQFSLLRSPDDAPRFRIGLFILIALITMLVSAWVGVTALSPTRHALIYLPIFALGIAEGAAFLLEKVFRKDMQRSVVYVAMLTCLLGMWIANLPSFLALRHDPFSEAEMNEIIDKTGAETAVEFSYTYNLDLMPTIRSRTALYNEQNLAFPWFKGRLPEQHAPILFISRQEPLTSAKLAELLTGINRTLPQNAQWHFCFDQNALLYKDERPSAQTVEIDPSTDSGRNERFIYVIDPALSKTGC